MPILPTAAAKLGADLPTAGFIAGLVMMGSLFFDLPAVRLVNRFGERRSMLVASVVGSTCLALMTLAPNLIVLGALIFVAGSMAAVFGLARHGYMAEHVPFSHRARALGVLGGSFRGGAFLGPIVGAGVVLVGGINAVYFLAAALCLISAIILALVKDDSASEPDPNAHSLTIFAVTKREFAKLRTVGVGSMSLALSRAARAIGLPLWGVYLGMNEAQISLYVGIAAFVDFALFFISGIVMDRFGRRAAAVPTLLAMGVMMFALTFANAPALFLLVAVLLSVGNAFGSGIVLTIGADLAPTDARNEFLAAYRLMMDFGTAGAPIAIATITAAASLPVAMVFISGVCFFGAGMMWRYLPKFGIR